ncbi:MAG: glycosyltransferase family 39 protein [Phycisphaerae bacterium]|nr:glycosyltransferase family 39 protein [Phycisphaerae bacterium]
MSTESSHHPKHAVAVWASAASVLALALVWRLLGVTSTQVWRDEAITLIHARAPWWELLAKLPWVEDSPSLGFLAFKLWSLVASSELEFRLLPVLAGVATVGVVMATAARIRKGSGWIAGLLSAFSHVLLHYSQEIRSYSFLALATAACFWFAENAARGERGYRSLLLLAVSALLAAHCHVAGLLVCPMVVVYLLVRSEGPARRRLLWWPAPVLWLAAVVPVICLARHWAPIHAADSSWWVPPLTGSRIAGLLEAFFGIDPLRFCDLVGGPPLRRWALFGLERWLIAAPAILAVAGLFLQQTRRQTLALAAAVATYTSLLVIAGTASAPGTAIRTLLPAWIPAVLLMSVGGAAAARRPGRVGLGIVSAALALSYAGVWVGYVCWGPDRRPPDQAPFAWLSERLGPDDMIVTHPALFEDEVVYYLGHNVAGEQLFTTANPVYHGQPPVHRMVPRTLDPHFQERLRAAANTGPRGNGQRGALFVISPIVGREPAMDEALHTLLPDRYTPSASTASAHESGVSIQRYAPATTR